MRRFFASKVKSMTLLILCAMVLLSFWGCRGTAYIIGDATTYFRIHIRANSNSGVDQDVKYLVRDEVVAHLTPILSRAQEFNAAVKAANANLNAVIETANIVLRRQGFSYRATALIREEDFPTRQYGKLILPAGRYESLIIELGGGTGDNWWCVAYPPLCFMSQEKVVIKSKIVEIFESMF